MTARLTAELSRIAGEAFAAEGLGETYGQVQISDRPDLAQFQCNGALAAAKMAGRSSPAGAKTNPRAIAEKIAARLKASSIFAKVEIAGPGFINLDLSDAALNDRATVLAGASAPCASEPNGKTVMWISAAPISPSRWPCIICAPPSSAIACNGSIAPMAGG